MPPKKSQRWLQEHFSDTYVKQAQQSGYRSRAVFKLLELQKKDKLFKSGMNVIELGAAPGGWSQVVSKLVAPKGRVIALDILPFEPIDNVEFIQGDFGDAAFFEKFLAHIKDLSIDWVISDMSPNLSGINSVDQARSLELAELAFDLAAKMLNKNGGFLVKVFQGEGFDDFIKLLKQHFKKVTIRKPQASRSRSREVYILCLDIKTA